MAEIAPALARNSSSLTASSGAWHGINPTARSRLGSAEQYSSNHSFTTRHNAAANSPLMRPFTVRAMGVPNRMATSMPSRSMSLRRSTGSVIPGRDLRAFSVNGPVTPGAGPCEGDHTLPSIRLRVYPRLSLTLTGACERHFSGKRLAKSILPSDTWPSASMTRTLSKLSMKSTSVVGVISQQTLQNSIKSPSRASGQTVNYLK